MKKVGYLVIGLLAGSILSTTAGAVAAQVKSLVGTKVVAEYMVTVDGKQLSDKAAIVDNKAMVPLRAVSDSLGAGIKLDSKNKKIEVVSAETTISSNEVAPETNKYMGRSEVDLSKSLENYKNNILAPTVIERDQIKNQVEALENSIATNTADIKESASLEAKKKQLAEYEQMIKDAEAEILLIQSAIDSSKQK